MKHGSKLLIISEWYKLKSCIFPEDGEKVLVAHKYGVSEAKYNRIQNHFNEPYCGQVFDFEEISHWMSLPKHPKDKK